jgi:hypothetical protein
MHMSPTCYDSPRKMPTQPTVSEIRLNNITKCFAITAGALEILVGSLKSPFLETISNTTQSLLKNIEVNYH